MKKKVTRLNIKFVLGKQKRTFLTEIDLLLFYKDRTNGLMFIVIETLVSRKLRPKSVLVATASVDLT